MKRIIDINSLEILELAMGSTCGQVTIEDVFHKIVDAKL